MATEYAQTNTDSVIMCDDLVELSVEQVHTTIQAHDYALVRGLFDQTSLRRSVENLRQNFDVELDNPPFGEPPEAVRTNFQKLSTGGASLRYNNFPRFFRTFYNPVWCDDVYGMRDNFKQLIRLRNKIYGIDLDFALDRIEDNGLWSATRIHQYPNGGGFFSGHHDTTLLDVAREKNANFYQLVLTMTEKGKDFESGGAFVDTNDKRFLIEDLCQVGDVLVYDGRSFHGVEDIDRDKKLDTHTINGRVIAMASLYKAH